MKIILLTVFLCMGGVAYASINPWTGQDNPSSVTNTPLGQPGPCNGNPGAPC